MLLCFQAGVLHRYGGHTEPPLSVKGTDFHLGILLDLLGYILHLAGLDGKPAVEEINGAKGPYPRLIPLHGGKILGSAHFKKSKNFLHGKGLLCNFLY